MDPRKDFELYSLQFVDQLTGTSRGSVKRLYSVIAENANCQSYHCTDSDICICAEC